MRIIALEGLSAVGKSTVAPLVASRLGIEQVPAISPELQGVRKVADAAADPTSRHLYYLWALTATCQELSDRKSDETVLIESYVGRTMAYHRGMGSQLGLDPWILLPRPTLSVLITCDEGLRQARIATRGALSYWQQRSEESIEQVRAHYAEFADVTVTNDRSLEDCVGKIVRLARHVTSG
jgi:dTMP kinase